MMMHQSQIVPNLVYRVTLPPGARVAVVAGNGLDVLFFLMHRQGEPEGHIVINDQYNGEWGAEIHLPLPPSDDPSREAVEFKFNGDQMEVWNSAKVVRFARFDADRCERVRFVRLNGAENPGRSLISNLESLDATLAQIETHLLHRRIDALEARLGAASSGAPSEA
jgi:hypothetical protein